ncbi:hypothetical protein ACFE04_024362 [Oxalis oulophora]
MAEVIRAKMMSDAEEVVSSFAVKLRTFALACLSMKGGEDNDQMELKVGSNDDDIDFEDELLVVSENQLQGKLIRGGALRPVVLAFGAGELQVENLDEQLVVLEVCNEPFPDKEFAAQVHVTLETKV